MSANTSTVPIGYSARLPKLIHLFFWILYGGINYLLSYLLLDNSSFSIGFTIVTLIFHIALVYFHLLVLLPRYLEVSKYQPYALLLVGAICGTAFLRLLGLEGVSDYAQLAKEPAFGLKVGMSIGSSIIVLLITAPFYFLDGWLNKRTQPVEEIEPVNEPTEPAYFFIRSENKLVKIFFDDITHIESLRDLVRIHTSTERHLSQHSMRKMMEILPAEQFVRVHRTYIIAFDKIQAVSGNVIELKGYRIPIGKTYREAFFQRLEVL